MSEISAARTGSVPVRDGMDGAGDRDIDTEFDLENTVAPIEGDEYHYFVRWLMPDSLAILVQTVANREGIGFHAALQHLVEMGLGR